MFCVVTFEHVCLQMRGFYIQLSHYSKHMCYLMRKIYHFTSRQKKYHAILYRSNFYYVYLDTFSFENEPKVDISYFTFTFWSEEKRMETFGWIQITLSKKSHLASWMTWHSEWWTIFCARRLGKMCYPWLTTYSSRHQPTSTVAISLV